MAQYTLKIALAAKGDFSTTSTYALLDVVRYNGASWACRKAVTAAGEWNEENWQLLSKDGEDGETPTIAIGTVTTGEEGTNADAKITGTSPNLTLDLTIPRGAAGNPGKDGTDAAFKILTAEPSASDLDDGEVAFVVES